MAFIFPVPVVLIFSILFGITFVLSQSLNKKGNQWFETSSLLFGILWGAFGSLLILSNNTVGNIVAALALAFLIRGFAAYTNNALAIAIICATTFFIPVAPALLFTFLFVFIVFGLLEDWLTKNYQAEEFVTKFSQSGWYFAVGPLLYCLFNGEWSVFLVFAAFTLSYIGTRFFDARRQSANAVKPKYLYEN